MILDPRKSLALFVALLLDALIDTLQSLLEGAFQLLDRLEVGEVAHAH